jgi:hypothetical protein
MLPASKATFHLTSARAYACKLSGANRSSFISLFSNAPTQLAIDVGEHAVYTFTSVSDIF